jgi:hypothetical protein
VYRFLKLNGVERESFRTVVPFRDWLFLSNNEDETDIGTGTINGMENAGRRIVSNQINFM